ncbi:MAG: TetR family transcriptional regulator [Thermoanaerobaculales bacterium]|nr:TetR family transcriptional regulator [Thermoanaerobaculales bacterium]
MNSQLTTRERLIEAAGALFSEHGYRGAAVRDICNLARANPGAISYHFGGKRQLYRAVLRSAVDHLAATTNSSENPSIQSGFRALEREITARPQAARLLLRDLADGGQMALEALAPALRNLRGAVGEAFDASEDPSLRREINQILLRLAAPLLLITAAWPLLERSLQLDEEDRSTLLAEAEIQI